MFTNGNPPKNADGARKHELKKCGETTPARGRAPPSEGRGADRRVPSRSRCASASGAPRARRGVAARTEMDNPLIRMSRPLPVLRSYNIECRGITANRLGFAAVSRRESTVVQCGPPSEVSACGTYRPTCEHPALEPT